MPEPLILQGTNITPNINFNPSINFYEISGYSMPENAHNFYARIIDWLYDNIDQLNTPVELNLKYTFISTSTLKALMELFKAMEEINSVEKDRIKIIWCYDEDDEDMQEKGEEFIEIVDVPFELKAY